MMGTFANDVLEAAAREKEVSLTTPGRSSGRLHRVTIWVATDGRRLFIRSGQGLKRHWPQNLLAGGGTLHVGENDVAVSPRHVSDAAEARDISLLYVKKYGPKSNINPSLPSEPLTTGESATFELIPLEP